MKSLKNIVFPGPHQKPIVLDAFFKQESRRKPLIIFAHGFKGFKDWGHWEVVGREFARRGFFFVKFNFSHNGTTPDHLQDFADLEAFGNNNFSIEMDDLGTVIDFVSDPGNPLPAQEIDPHRLALIGHSRGGGIVILKAREDRRVGQIATWASVNEFGRYWPEALMKVWEKEGVQYVVNARTGQQMPIYWQLYQNYRANQERLHIPSAVRELRIPFLILHGSADPVVSPAAAEEMARWNPGAELKIIPGADHTFGGKHPWKSKQLPEKMQQVVAETARFFERHWQL